MYNILLRLPFVCFLFLSYGCLNAQFNFKIAYNLDYSTFASHNALMEQYHEANPWLTTKFGKVTFLNGLHLGARVRNEFLGIDLTWERSTAQRNASGINFSDVTIDQELDYRLNKFSLAFETYSKFVGVGANVTWERFTLSNTVARLDSKNTILTDDRLGNRLYLIFQTKGTERLGLSLQPYLYLPWSHYNISPLASFLDVKSDEFNIQKNLHFGLSLVFYNGRQRP